MNNNVTKSLSGQTRTSDKKIFNKDPEVKDFLSWVKTTTKHKSVNFWTLILIRYFIFNLENLVRRIETKVYHWKADWGVKKKYREIEQK